MRKDALTVLVALAVVLGACSPAPGLPGPSATLVATVALETETEAGPVMPTAGPPSGPTTQPAPSLTPFQPATLTPEPTQVEALGRFVRLTQLLEMGVQSADQQAVAQVDGLLIQNPIPVTGGASAQAGPGRPYISYVLVTVSAPDAGLDAAPNQDNQVLVPWGVLSFDRTSFQPGGAVVYSIDPLTLRSAPRFSTSAPADREAFWSGQGISIPATGSQSQTGTILIRDQLAQIGVFSGEEELRLGEAVDFIIDTTSGEVTHALLAGGETFGERTYAIPTQLLIWEAAETAAEGLDVGRLLTTFAPDLFTAAPFFDDLDPNDPVWQELVAQFWAQVQPGQ